MHKKGGAVVDIIIDVVIAFFASIGFLNIVWFIIDSFQKRRQNITGTLIYIPDNSNDEKEFDFEEGNRFTGEVIVMASTEATDVDAASLLGTKFKKTQSLKVEAVCLGKRCDGAFDI